METTNITNIMSVVSPLMPILQIFGSVFLILGIMNFACSIGQVSQEIIEKYIQNQDNVNERRVSTHLKACGFTADNL